VPKVLGVLGVLVPKVLGVPKVRQVHSHGDT
jgi:hypothetical protein